MGLCDRWLSYVCEPLPIRSNSHHIAHYIVSLSLFALTLLLLLLHHAQGSQQGSANISIALCSEANSSCSSKQKRAGHQRCFLFFFSFLFFFLLFTINMYFVVVAMWHEQPCTRHTTNLNSSVRLHQKTQNKQKISNFQIKTFSSFYC